jgi:hypothetical protein
MNPPLTWILVNLVFPALAAPAVIFLAHLFIASTPEQERDTKLSKYLSDGKYAWLALAWSASGIFKMADQWGVEGMADFAKGMIFLETVLIIIAVVICLGSVLRPAITLRSQITVSLGSMIVALVSGVMLIFIQSKLPLVPSI